MSISTSRRSSPPQPCGEAPSRNYGSIVTILSADYFLYRLRRSCAFDGCWPRRSEHPMLFYHLLKPGNDEPWSILLRKAPALNNVATKNPDLGNCQAGSRRILGVLMWT